MTATSTISAPVKHPDGFNGAREAAILDRYSDAGATSGTVHVQAVGDTRALLRRAGVRRITTHAYYPVAVVRDHFNRLQLAPAPVAAVEPAALKPCPCCRVAPMITIRDRQFCVECSNNLDCTEWPQTTWYPTPERARAAWNEIYGSKL